MNVFNISHLTKIEIIFNLHANSVFKVSKKDTSSGNNENKAIKNDKRDLQKEMCV